MNRMLSVRQSKYFVRRLAVQSTLDYIQFTSRVGVADV